MPKNDETRQMTPMDETRVVRAYDDTRPAQYQESPPPPPPKRRGGCLRNCFVLTLLGIIAVAFAGILVTGTVIYVQFSAELDEGIERLENARTRETFETTRIVDRNGETLWEIFGEGKRTYIALSEMPDSLKQATISVEDDTFYENEGADIPSLIAALIYNFRNPNERPVGASTITQQLVRHIAFDYEERTAVSYDRKAKEIILAWLMTREYSKDDILEMYLNEIYYGNLAYGVEAAAQTYFGKTALELSTAEATLLAALPQSPVQLDPLNNFEAAKQRQWIVLNLMVSEGYLSPDQPTPIYQTGLTFAEQSVSLQAPHFANYVRQELETRYGAEEVANGGLVVTTSIDLRFQRLAEQLADQHVSVLREPHNLTNAALVAMKPGTGEILAMLGSVDYRDETIDGQVNVATSQQQPGSAIKPLTYAAALLPDPATGRPRWQPGDILWDVKTDYVQTNGVTYTPVNYDRVYHGPVRFRDALANSYNVPAVLLLQDVGVPNFLEFAQRMGIQSFGSDASRYGLSLTLGGAELTPLELTSAYAVFANEGYRVPPVAILKVTNSAGEVLEEYTPPAATEPTIDPRIAHIITDILSDDAARMPAMGRDNPLDLPFSAAAKTGTTDDFRDNWTVGYTPGIVVGVWAGNTDNSEMVNVSGLTGAAPLWNSYMEAVYNDFGLLEVLGNGQAQPPTEFTRPNGLEERSLCSIPSVVPGADTCAPGRTELFLPAGAGDGSAPVPTATPAPDTVAWVELEPSVVVAPAVPLAPLPPDQLAGDPAAAQTDEDELPPLDSCHFNPGVPIETLPPDAAAQVFLRPPRNPESAVGAYNWAQANGVAILPYEACNDDLLAQARDPNSPAVWRLTSPKNGDTVSGNVPIEGVADFDTGRVQFYKIELGLPQNGDLNNVQWFTLGETHSTPVPRGQLEMLSAGGLAPGEYFLRLIVVQNDGNYVGPPDTIQITVEP